MRRVVVTGIGMVSPLGCGVATSWSRLIDGASGISALESADFEDLPARIAGQVAFGSAEENLFDPDLIMPPKDQRKIDRFILFGIAAGQEAIEDSGWLPSDEEAQNRTGILIGSGIGGLVAISDTAVLLK